MGVPCCNSRGTRMSPTAGDDVDTEVSTFRSGGPSDSVGFGDCCFDVVIKVCSLRFKEPRDDGRGSFESVRLPALRRGGGSCITATGAHLSWALTRIHIYLYVTSYTTTAHTDPNMHHPEHSRRHPSVNNAVRQRSTQQQRNHRVGTQSRNRWYLCDQQAAPQNPHPEFSPSSRIYSTPQHPSSIPMSSHYPWRKAQPTPPTPFFWP